VYTLRTYVCRNQYNEKPYEKRYLPIVPTNHIVPPPPPPKNVECVISEYVDCKKGTIFLANNLLIAKFPRPSSHTSNTVDKLNKSKSSGLVNVFILVLPLVKWWWCYGEFDHDGGGGGGCGPAAVVAAVVAAMDNDWWQKRPATRALTVA
jgi:hypothetical protein